jgi:uncharacterized membrane protein
MNLSTVLERLQLPAFVTGRPRLFIGLLCGIIAFWLLPTGLQGPTRAICAWDIGAVAFLILAGVLFYTEPPEKMSAHAAAQQEGEWTIFWITVAVVLISFAAIIGEFSGTKALPANRRGLHVALVALTLFVSWLMTHVSFGLRYAHEYYTTSPGRSEVDGGLQFPSEPTPDYLDFLYFSLVLGMTFQVSDVQITSRKFRRLAAVHGLLSFLFNAVIIALTVNIAASFL